MIDRIAAWAGSDGKFWAAVVGAALFKAVTSERLGLKAVLLTFGMAIFCAWIGTDPVMIFFKLGEEYREVTAVAVALTGETIMRTFILVTNDPEFIRDIIKKRLGGGK